MQTFNKFLNDFMYLHNATAFSTREKKDKILENVREL